MYLTSIFTAVIKSRELGFPPATMNIAPGYFHRKIEPEEIPSYLIPRILVVFTRQLEISVTALYMHN